MFQSLPGATVFYPSDAVTMEQAIELGVSTPDTGYRIPAGHANPALYANDEVFKIGQAKVISHQTVGQGSGPGYRCWCHSL